MDLNELKLFLNEKVQQYNTSLFIEPDPISVPHLFSQKEDIEIAGFLAATISWGNRKMITKNAHRMIQLFGESPYDFVMSSTEAQQERLSNFVHRTFKGEDLIYFVHALRHIYLNYGGIEAVFKKHQGVDSFLPAITAFYHFFFEIEHPKRTEKHVANPDKGSVAKRLNMYLRWMCRKDNSGVDLGVWNLSPAKLSCPLDVHSGNVARKLGLINRKANDQKALYELDMNLRNLDPNDPVKYDFALFGLGIFEGF